MTSKQKLGAIQHSLNQAEMGINKIVHCPYCNSDMDFGGDAPPKVCCETFALAAIAITQRKELTEAKDLASRIRSNAGGLPVFN